MLIRIIELIHYFCFICFSFFIILSIWDIFFIENSVGGYSKMFLLQGNGDAKFMGTTFYIYIFMPFIRYIIFGRLGWFPWSSFRKD